MRKKWLAAVLCLCLVVGLLPGTALAADGEPASPWEVTAKSTGISADVVYNHDGYGSLVKRNPRQAALIDRDGNFKFQYRDSDNRFASCGLYKIVEGLPVSVDADSADADAAYPSFWYSAEDDIVSFTTGLTWFFTLRSYVSPAEYYHLDGSTAFTLGENFIGGPVKSGYARIMELYDYNSHTAKKAQIINKNGTPVRDLTEKYLWTSQEVIPEYLGQTMLNDCSENLFSFIDYVSDRVDSNRDYDHPNKVGFMDVDGNIVLDLGNRYLEVGNLVGGVAYVVDRDYKIGFIDKAGNLIIPCQYEACYNNGGLIAVKKDGKWGFIDNNGKTVIPFEYDVAFGGPEGLLPVAKDGKYGLIDSANRIVVPLEYDDISEYIDGVAYAIKGGKVTVLTGKGPSLSDMGIYTISFDTKVTSITVPSQKTGVDGTLSSLPSPAREDFKLDGWFTAQEGGVKISTDYVFTRDTTVYAKWTSTGQEQPVNPDDSNKPDNPDNPDNPNNPDNNGSSSNGGGGGGSSKPSIRPGANTNKPTTPATPTTPNTPSSSASSFSDVRSSDWHAAAVNYVVSRGIMNGTGNGVFSPNATTTRGMVMTMLARLSGVSTDGGSVWYERGMQWAKEQGISDGSNPNGAVSREQLVSMLYRSMNSPAVSSSLAGFPDASNVSSWAADAMAWAVSNGLIQGDNKGALNPNGSATRAEVATILMRYCEKFGK